jgi:RecA-family ATPase
MIDLDGFDRDPWQAQKKFVQAVRDIIVPTQARVLLIHHTRKTAPGASRQSGLSESAGSKTLTDFCDSAVFLEHHPDGVESDVKESDSLIWPLTHRRTLYVAKTRDGQGTGWKIACDFSEARPELIEHGFVQRAAPRRAGR